MRRCSRVIIVIACRECELRRFALMCVSLARIARSIWSKAHVLNPSPCRLVLVRYIGPNADHTEGQKQVRGMLFRQGSLLAPESFAFRVCENAAEP